MEDGRDSAMESSEQDRVDNSFSVSDAEDTIHSSDTEQDKVQISSSDLDGRSTAEPPSSTSDPQTLMSDEESGSIALDDSLAEEDAVLKSNLELMSENEDASRLHNASEDLQLSSDSSSSFNDLNSSTKSESEGHSNKCSSSDVISQINMCLNSLNTNHSVIDSNDAEESNERDCQRICRTESEVSVKPSSVHENNDVEPFKSDSFPQEEVKEVHSNINSEEPHSEAAVPFASTGDPDELGMSSTEDVVHHHLEEPDTDSIIGKSSLLTLGSENNEDGALKLADHTELSSSTNVSLPVLDQSNVMEKGSVCEDIAKTDAVNVNSAETNVICVDSNVKLQEDKCLGSPRDGTLCVDSVISELNSDSEHKKDALAVGQGFNLPRNIPDQSYPRITDSYSDEQDEVNSEEEKTGENSINGSFSRLNGGLSDCDESSIPDAPQVAPYVSCSSQSPKRVVTSNALNAAWKKAFANTAKKYESPTPPEISVKSPDLEETSDSGSSAASSSESQEEDEDGDDKNCNAEIQPGVLVENESSVPTPDVAHDTVSTSEFVGSTDVAPVCEEKDTSQEEILLVSEQPPQPQASSGTTCEPNVEKNALVSHPPLSGHDKRLANHSQSLSGLHVNIANPIPEYPQYLGVQPTVKFKCVRCGVKGFTSMRELKNHQLSCSKSSSPAPQAHQLSTSPSASTNFRITRKVYLCSACGTYYENWNLFLHMREVHKRHICLFCLGMFSQAEKLSLHLVSKHKVTEGHYLSPQDFKCSFKGSCFLMCCTCEKMFTEDNFTNHICRGDLVVCAVCGGEGVHLPSCQLSSSSRNLGHNQPKRLQSTPVPEAVKSSPVTQKTTRRVGAMEGKRISQPNYRGNKLGKKASGSNKPKQILKVKIPIKPPTLQDSSNSTNSQLLSKSKNALGSSTNSPLRPGMWQEALPVNMDMEAGGPTSYSNLDKTINAVALGLTDEAQAWEDQMEAERNQSQSARQIYTDSGEDSDELDRENNLLHPSPSDKEIEEETFPMVLDEETHINDEGKGAEETHINDEGKGVLQLSGENLETAENQTQPQSVEASLQNNPLPGTELEAVIPEENVSKDTDSDSEKLSQIVDKNQHISEEEHADSIPETLHPSEEGPLCEPISLDSVHSESAPETETTQEQEEHTVESFPNRNLEMEEMPSEDILMQEPCTVDTCPEEAPSKVAPEVENFTTDTLSGASIGIPVCSTPQHQINDNEENVNVATDSSTLAEEEVPENKLVEGYTLAGSDVPETELSLDKPLHIMKTQEVLKECVRTLCWSCVYCSHAKKIAVNGKQLALHVLSEHRIIPVDGTSNEVPAAERFILKLKEALDPLHGMHFNTDSYDSTDVVNSLPYDRSYECFHCHFYTRLHKELYIHNRKMHQKTILLCIMCKSNFYSYSELLCHLCPGIYIPHCNVTFRCCMCNLDQLPSAFRLMVHLRKRHHACDVCLETTDDQQKLSSHVWKHKLHHLCYRCGIAYRNKPDITKHLFWKHGTESVLCKKCLQKKWPHVYHFCVPPTSFVCEECSASFSRAVCLRVHKRLHSEDFRYSCTDCEDKFISKKLLAKHKVKHDTPAPPPTEVFVEEEKENVIPKPDSKHSPLAKSTDEEERPKALEEKITSGMTSPSEKKHLKKKKHRKDEREAEAEKQKKSVDVFDLPPLNLSSDSDSSEDEGKKLPGEIPPEPTQEQQPAVSAPCTAAEDKMEVEEPAPVIDGIWDKFQNFQASLEKRESLDDPEQFMRRTVMMDHDYCLPSGKPSGTLPSSTIGGDSQTSDIVASSAIPEPSTNASANETPKSSPIKRKKTPKKRERQNSGRASSSSSSDSSSDSDSSSCSCGSNCSCSSSSSSSSGSSSSSSDSDDSSSSEGHKNISKKERHKEKSEKDRVEEKDEAVAAEQVNAVPTMEEPHIDVLEAEPTVRESDLDTTETDTDEDFYDDNPQKFANELLQEKRNLMLLAAVAPINNGGLSPTQSSSSQPPPTVIPEPAPVKRKGKKRRKRQFTSPRQVKNSHTRLTVSSQNVLTSAEPQFSTYSEQSGHQDIDMCSATQPYSAPLYYPPQTPNLLHNSPAAGSPLSQVSQPATSKTKKGQNSKIHHYSVHSFGSGSETEGRTKRKRMRNRFYGFGSDEDEDSSQQTNIKVKKSGLGTSYQSLQEPVQPTMPPLTIKRSQVQPPPPDPFYQSPLPSSTWNTNLISTVKSDSDNDSDVPEISKVNASSSSDTDSDDDAMQIAESPPPPPQFEAPRTGENKDNLYCYCQCPYDEVSEMIACDGVDCRIEWFHFECVGIMVPPKGQWYCPDCRRRMSGGQDYMLN